MKPIRVNLNGWFDRQLSSTPFSAGVIIPPERVNAAWLAVVEKDTYIDEYGLTRFCCEWVDTELPDTSQVVVDDDVPIKELRGRKKKEIEINL